LRLNKQPIDLQYVTTIHPKQTPLELNKLKAKMAGDSTCKVSNFYNSFYIIKPYTASLPLNLTEYMVCFMITIEIRNGSEGLYFLYTKLTKNYENSV